ncbi:MAG TPA: UDP-N-acetylmuramoyl-L-alanyl-D-glutamate--2,6-diaminopimelate ligase, partial [Betaproteobacteria bacterium]|nr:UDP-N-acetylmuramoyl-L-alanyl-D-glutamate--2,6-diaminopimelate ligase [Betaproteobacteria bacterium]
MSARRLSPDAADILAALTPLGATLRGLSADSRHITTGDGFAAYPGEAGDGRDYIDKAIAAGASAVLWEQQDFSWPARWADVPNLGVANLKARVGEIAAQLYGQPAQALWMIGVTGT